MQKTVSVSVPPDAAVDGLVRRALVNYPAEDNPDLQNYKSDNQVRISNSRTWRVNYHFKDG